MGINFSRSFGSASHVPYFQEKIQLQFTLYPWHLGLFLFCSPLEEVRFQQLTPYSDYYSSHTLCCDHLLVIMAHRLTSLEGCFPPPPESPLSSELLLEWEIDNANNPFQYFLIANYHLWSVHRQSSPPIFLPHFNWHILKNNPFWLLIIYYDWFRRKSRHKLHS